MIRLIIAEDELTILNGIFKHMPWQQLGVDEVKCAENANMALDISKVFSPDIIITDIRMPGQNGIEFGKRICELFHSAK